jgi:hypothetical protein
MVNTQGRSDSFYDGGASARLNSHGAMQESVNMDGPAGISTNNGQHDYAGATAPKPQAPGFSS